MGFFGSFYGGGGGGSTPVYSPSTIVTAENIRDAIYAAVEAMTAVYLAGDRFRRFRNELDADFDAWAEKNPTAALRRFQVREVGDDELPQTSSGLEERVRARFQLRMAYPQTNRYGKECGMDRDDVMNDDWKQINLAVGIYGGATYTGTANAIPLGATKTREQGGKIDYLVIDIDVEYLRATS